MEAILSKWGNGQGLRVPKDACSSLNIAVGSKAEVTVDAATSSITFDFSKHPKKYHRTKRITMEELTAGWDGGKVGEEWNGADVGAEVVL